MEIDAELQGVEETFQMMEQLVNRQEKALKGCIEWILEKMVNYAKSKEGGNYEDHTSNLRNSISVNIKTMKEYPADTDPQVLKSVAKQNEQPVIEIEGDDYYGVLSCGMEYGIWVELTSGFRVLQGAIDKFEPLIEQYMSDFLSVENLDLEHIATVQYMKQYGGD